MAYRFGLTLLAATALLVPALPALPANAASFDCAKAASFFEKAICAEPELSADDDTLAVAYATALGGLSQDAAAIVKDGQRSWLDLVQHACTPDAEPAKAAYDEAGLSCLHTQYQQRIRQLENSRMVGRYRVYTADSFAAAPDPDGTDWSRVATKLLSSPRIDGKSELASAFNTAMAEQTADFAETIAKGPGSENFDVSSDEWIELKVISTGEQRIGVERTDYWYGHGAAHGQAATTYLHFLPAQNRLLEASDVFAAEGWEEKLADLTFTQLKADLGDILQVDDVSDIADIVVKPERWNFSDQGLQVQFQPYEVASYADGSPVVTLSWNKLQDLLTDDATNIAWF